MLIVGNRDIANLNGHNKSGKHLKNEALIAGGQQIRIIGEADFTVLSAIPD